MVITRFYTVKIPGKLCCEDIRAFAVLVFKVISVKSIPVKTRCFVTTESGSWEHGAPTYALPRSSGKRTKCIAAFAAS